MLVNFVVDSNDDVFLDGLYTLSAYCIHSTGCAGVLAGQPLDTVKVRLQTQSAGKYRGIIHCMTSIVKKEGARGLYKGEIVGRQCLQVMMR